MESWSRYIFNSMKPMMLEDAKKEVREQAWAEGMAEGRLEGAMLLKKVNHLLAKGMSDEEILTALPNVTVDFMKYARESYEEDHQL